MKKRIISLVLLGISVLTVTACAALQAQSQRMAEKIIRLHVVANSDSDADQSVKLRVRDAVLREAQNVLSDASDAKQAIAAHRGGRGAQLVVRDLPLPLRPGHNGRLRRRSRGRRLLRRRDRPHDPRKRRVHGQVPFSGAAAGAEKIPVWGISAIKSAAGHDAAEPAIWQSCLRMNKYKKSGAVSKEHFETKI